MGWQNRPMPYAPKSPQGQDPEPETTDQQEPSSPFKPRVTAPRKTIWLIGIGVGVYLIASGIWQLIF